MAKDVNIHIKATGGAEAKQQLEGVAQGAQKVGSGVQDMGSKALTGSGWVQKALSFLAGPAGFAAITTALAAGAIKVANFFDEIKTRADEAVRQVQQIRSAYIELFQVMDTFSEKGRQVLALKTIALLQKTAVTEQVGLPVVTAYAREFQPFLKRGEITEPQYKQGLEQMLRYAGRKGPLAAGEILPLMTGFGLIQPQQQAGFGRMITAAAKEVGLPEVDFAEAMGRGMTGFKALGLGPEQAINMAGQVAITTKGMPPRQRATMLSNVLGALINPQVPKEFEKKIPKEFREDPAKLFNWFRQQQKILPQKDYLQLLSGAYGKEAAPGLYSYITAPEISLNQILQQAAGPVGAAREAQQEKARQETSEAITARAKAATEISQIKRQTTEREMRTEVRTRGIAAEERISEEYPIRRELETLTTATSKAEMIQEAAAAEWWDNLPPEEKEGIEAEYRQRYPLQRIRLKKYGTAYWKWRQMNTKQRYEALTPEEANHESTTTINNFHQHHEMIFNPVAGNRADLMGPRVPKNIH